MKLLFYTNDKPYPIRFWNLYYYPMKRISFLLALFAWGVGLYAQFVPAPTVPTDTTALFEELSQRIEVVPADIPEAYREKYAEINEERFQDIQDEIRDSSFLFHPDLQVFLDGLMKDIIEANNLEVDPLVLIVDLNPLMLPAMATAFLP